MGTATTPREQRLRRVASAMDAAGVDALVLCPGADLYYLTGFEHGHAGERLLSLVVRRDGSSRWIVPAMNVPQVQPHALSGEPVTAWSDAEGYLPALRTALEGAENVAFDDEARSAFLLDVTAVSPKSRPQRASAVMRALRIRKDAAELAALRRAGRTVDETIADAISFCRPGRTERQVEQDLRAALLRRASAGASVAFTIVASGENAALPHHETSDRALRPGDVVVLDVGTRG